MFTTDELILLAQVHHDGMSQEELLKELHCLNGTDEETRSLIKACSIKAKEDINLASLKEQLNNLDFDIKDLQNLN